VPKNDLEDQIRNRTLRKRYYQLVEEDIRVLIVPHLSTFVHVDCPNCGQKGGSLKFKKGLFRFIECGKCGMLFVNPRPHQYLLDKYYRESKAMKAFSDILLDSEKKRRDLFYKPRVRDVMVYLKEKKVTRGRLLEVGCSIGTMLALFKDSGFDLFGMDPDPKACKIARKKYGIHVFQTALEEFRNDQENPFEVLLNFETIEHISCPLSFLQKINTIMTMKGHLVLTTPNWGGFDIKVLGEKYKNVYGPNHLNYFDVRTIDAVLSRAGFTVTKKMTPGILDVTVLKNQILSGECGDVNPFIHDLLFRCPQKTVNDFQSFLQRHLLSSNMMVFAQKRREIKPQ
jgi:2-polyprenyl-3-methyl-5-hydroxy-6-metoxy-1,4-benzoquinol methylase/ribosomal protein S27E